MFSALLFAPHPHPHLQEGLWTPTKKVSAEDVSHMQNRVLHFHFNHVFGRGDLQEVPRSEYHECTLFVSVVLGLGF